nr:MAG TPA: hypothetical protein [Bacteriophage sp.]
MMGLVFCFDFDTDFDTQKINLVFMHFLRLFLGVRLPSPPPTRRKTRSPCGCGFFLHLQWFADFH